MVQKTLKQLLNTAYFGNRNLNGGSVPEFEDWKISDLKKLYNLLEVNGLDQEELIKKIIVHFKADKKDIKKDDEPIKELKKLTVKEQKAVYNTRYREKQKALK
jgi:hypothetical protein